MIEIEARTKKWGDSIAIIIPSDVAREVRVKVGDKYMVRMVRVGNFSKLFGSGKGKIRDIQKAKDEARKGWM